MTERVSSLLCICLILLFAIFFSVLALRQHQAYLTNGLDIGNVDQALWNTAQGRFLHFSLMAPVESRLALHVEPILLLFVPFYWLNLGGPELLLVVQATIVAIGAWPVYQLSTFGNYQLTINNSTHIPHPMFLVFPLAYLLLPTLQSAILFDFHAVTLASTFLLFAFLALEQRNNRRFFVFVVLAMACKEDMPLVVAMLGLYAGLTQGRWRLAGVTLGLSIAWFVVAVFVVQPQFAAGGNIQLERYAWLGNSPSEMLETLVTQPDLVFNHLWYQADLPDYLAALFFPTAFLALFSPLTLLPMLPTLAVNLLSGNPFTWRLEDFHYGAPLAPFLMISTIYGIRRITMWVVLGVRTSVRLPQKRDASILILLLTLLLVIFTGVYHYHRGYTPLSHAFVWPAITPHHQQLNAILATIPPDTPLFAQSNLAPHLSHRRTIYTDFAYFTDPNFPAQETVQDVVLDITTFENFGGLHQFLRQTLFESGNYQLVTAQDGILHLTATDDGRRTTAGYDDVSLPTSFYTFTQPNTPPDYNLQVDFGDKLRLHGYTLHFNRQEEIQVTVDLEPLQPLESLQPVLYLLDPEGQPIGATTDLQPTLVWYPVEQWSVGEVVRVRFNTLPWYTRETPIYGLALGVTSGSDVWNVGQRLRPSISDPTNLATRLPADGTLIELAQIKQKANMPQGGPRHRQFIPPVIPFALDTNFDNQIKLLGHTNYQLPITNNQLTIILYWQATITPEPLTRFVQLVGPDGRVYGQQDSVPDFGNYPTSLWQPGEVVVDTVTFPIDKERPAGNYTLHIGLYRPNTGERLLLQSGADHVEIPASD